MKRETKLKTTLNFPVIIFLVSEFFTVVLWDIYFNRISPVENIFGSVLILSMGSLFSISAGLFAWSLVSRSKYLEKEVTKRTLELENANRMLLDKTEEIENFIYTISHDLKAPLVSIQGFTNILQTDLAQVLNEETKHYLERICVNTEQMHRFIRDLLELSRVGRLEEALEEINLRKLIEELLVNLNPQLEAKRINVRLVGEFPTLYAAQNRILQVFSNLVGNAIKYIGQPENPFIEIGCLSPAAEKRTIKSKQRMEKAESNNLCTFYVKDNGLGIPKEFQNKVFMIFQRVHTEGVAEGTGIGLSIVKKIVENYGGKIWLESEVGRGSTFYFTLPTKRG